MKQWIYIAGGGRSGTTLLASLLTGTLDAFDCGELHLLWQSLVDGRLCTCGVEVSRCPIWSDVAERALDDLGLSRHEDGAEIMGNRLRQWQLMLPRLPRPHDDELSLRRATEAALEAVVDASAYVDSSKLSSVLWTAVRIDRPLNVIHIVRDPRAVAFSWSRPSPDPSLNGELMRAKKTVRSSIDWVRANVTTLRVLRSAPYYNIRSLRYEDLASQPKKMMEELSGLINRDLVGFSYPLIDRSHAIAGNPKRYIADQEIRLDVRWKKDMKVADRLAATLLTLLWLSHFKYPVWPR